MKAPITYVLVLAPLFYYCRVQLASRNGFCKVWFFFIWLCVLDREKATHKCSFQRCGTVWIWACSFQLLWHFKPFIPQGFCMCSVHQKETMAGPLKWLEWKCIVLSVFLPPAVTFQTIYSTRILHVECTSERNNGWVFEMVGHDCESALRTERRDQYELALTQ